MAMLSNYKKRGSSKIKYTVIIGYVLVVAVMALGLLALYRNWVDYSDQKIKRGDMSELLIVGNTLSLLYEIESEQNLINAESAEQYFLKYDSIAPKIKANLDELKLISIDTTRITKLDTIQLLVDKKRENLQEVAALLDSIRHSPIKLVQTETSYVPEKLNREIAEFLGGKDLSGGGSINESDTSVVAGGKRGFLDRVRDVFVGRTDSTLVIEKKSVVSDNEFKLLVDTLIRKVRYSEMLDLEQQRKFQVAYLARQEAMSRTNRLLTARIDELLKGIEQEELEKSLQLILEKERTISGSQRIMFIASCVALLIAFVFAVLFLVDINKSQRYRRELEASHKRISDLLAWREKLILTISHDIKAPMSSILGFIELMDPHGDHKSEAYLQHMKNSGEHILELASALLDYHKLEEGSWLLKESNIYVREVIDNCAASFAPLAARKDLEYIVDNQLPEDWVAYTDSYMLCQIMTNLISNAIKYTSEGSVLVKAQLEDNDSRKQLLISVTDTGPGIDDADQQIIFQEFKQLENSIGIEGSGLGLAITKGFVDALDGNIRLHSRKGEGAQFIVELPLKEAVVEQAQGNDEVKATQRNLEGVSVLLVDDDPIQLTMTSEMLATMNVNSVTETNPDKVLPLLESQSFDMLFMDIQMPGTDGLTLIGKIRSMDSNLLKEKPVIGLSARSDIPEEEMRAAGFTGFLTKPFTSAELYGAIRRYLFGENRVSDAMMPEEEPTSKETGPRALIAFVSDDKQTSSAILQSFIDETGSSRMQLENAIQEKDEKIIQRIAHKILPMFRLMGDRSLIALLARMEKGELLEDDEAAFTLTQIDNCLKEAEILKNEIEES